MNIKVLISMLALGGILISVHSGCGGSEAAEVHLTKKQFLKKGEEICNQAEQEQFEGAGRYAQKHPNAEDIELVVPVALPPIEKEITKLSALSAPVDDEGKVEAFINALEAAVTDAKDDPMDVLVSQTDPFKKPDKLASDYGFSVCANNP